MSTETQNTHTTIHLSSQSIFAVLLAVALAAVAFLLLDLLLAVFTGVVIAAAINPAVQWFQRKRIPRIPAVIIVYALILVSAAVIIGFLLRPLTEQTISFLNQFPDYMRSLEVWLAPAGDQESSTVFQAGSQGIAETLSLQEVTQELRQTLAGLSSNLFSVVATVFGGVVSFVLIVVLSFYLSMQENGVRQFLSLITPAQYEPYALDLWSRAEQKIGLWMRGQLILALIVGVVTYAGLWLLGVEHALVLAFLAAVFELIPLFGPVLAAIPAIAVAFLGGGLTFALIVLVFYVIVQQIESQVIYPLVVRQVVGLSPVIVIIALVAGAQLAGFLGILLSVPAAAILMEALNDFDRSRMRGNSSSSRTEPSSVGSDTTI